MDSVHVFIGSNLSVENEFSCNQWEFCISATQRSAYHTKIDLHVHNRVRNTHTHTATDTQAQSDMHIHAMNEIQYRTCIEATNSGK